MLHSTLLMLLVALSSASQPAIEWTLPPAFAEVICGDGKQVRRPRIDLSDQGAFSHKELKVPVELKGEKWVRFEVWDIAANGAFSRPVWVE